MLKHPGCNAEHKATAGGRVGIQFVLLALFWGCKASGLAWRSCRAPALVGRASASAQELGASQARGLHKPSHSGCFTKGKSWLHLCVCVGGLSWLEPSPQFQGVKAGSLGSATEVAGSRLAVPEVRVRMGSCRLGRPLTASKVLICFLVGALDPALSHFSVPRRARLLGWQRLGRGPWCIPMVSGAARTAIPFAEHLHPQILTHFSPFIHWVTHSTAVG